MIHVSFKKLSGRQKRNNVAWIFGLIVILIYAVLINPAETNISTCRFHELTGLDCPTCGISRSFYALSRFDFLNAFRHHIFGPILFLIFIVLTIFFIVELISNKHINIQLPFIKFKWLAGVFMGLWLATWMFKILI